MRGAREHEDLGRERGGVLGSDTDINPRLGGQSWGTRSETSPDNNSRVGPGMVLDSLPQTLGFI